MIGHEGILAHNFSTLADTDERIVARGKLASYSYGRDRILFNYEPV